MLARDSRLTEARRIAIVGIGGSGKSTISTQIAARTGLPLLHMDQLFWTGVWEEVPMSEYIPKHEALVAQDAWIIEGFIDKSMRSRAERADLIIWLDYSGLLCLRRVLGRWWKHRNVGRPEYAPEMREEITPKFWWDVFWRNERHGIVDALKDIPETRIVRLQTPEKLVALLNS